MKCSLHPKLQIGFVCSIRIRSRNRDIVEISYQVDFNPPEHQFYSHTRTSRCISGADYCRRFLFNLYLHVLIFLFCRLWFSNEGDHLCNEIYSRSSIPKNARNKGCRFFKAFLGVPIPSLQDSQNGWDAPEGLAEKHHALQRASAR